DCLSRGTQEPGRHAHPSAARLRGRRERRQDRRGRELRHSSLRRADTGGSLRHLGEGGRGRPLSGSVGGADVSAPAPPPLLSVKDLAYAYNGVAAVRGVSLEVGAGEVVALLGANGAGKTTTVKTIAGALAPQAGSIRFDGEAIDSRPCHVVVRRGITLVPEGRLVFPQLSVRENLAVGAHTRPT